MTLMEAIEKFRKRVENSPAFLEMKEKLKKMAEQNNNEDAEQAV